MESATRPPANPCPAHDCSCLARRSRLFHDRTRTSQSLSAHLRPTDSSLFRLFRELAAARELFENPLHPYTQGLMGSFPALTGEKKKLNGIPGAPPDMIDPPSGCAFHPRCSQVQPMHKQVVPQLREVAPEHYVACHLY
ncbi:MAG: oligopeptide/dipeptide ABC transporter ATP-binding protein [Chloroflexota bacterium]